MHRVAIAAMGTRFEIALVEAPGVDPVAAGEAAIAEIGECHARLSRFSTDSLVSHLARAGADESVRLDRDTYELFADALAVWQASGGAFDITVAPLMERHGYAPSAVAPTESTGSAAIVLDHEHWTVAFREAGIALDFGAIAKGHALDLAAAVLLECGVTTALLHGGTSSVLAIGAPGGLDGWPVAVQFGHSRRIVNLRNLALSVSDPASQGGESRVAHIMDPRHRRPVEPSRRVLVTGPSARRCDAWSTALAVLGAVPPSFPQGFGAEFDPDTP